MVKTYHHTKTGVTTSTTEQTDRQRDRDYENITPSARAGGQRSRATGGNTYHNTGDCLVDLMFTLYVAMAMR